LRTKQDRKSEGRRENFDHKRWKTKRTSSAENGERASEILSEGNT